MTMSVAAARASLARPAACAVALLLGAGGMFLTRWVQVKMLPFDDKNEVQVVLDLPEGTPLETTVALATDIGSAVGGTTCAPGAASTSGRRLRAAGISSSHPPGRSSRRRRTFSFASRSS